MILLERGTKTGLACFLILIYGLAKGQNYVHFPDSGAYWTVFYLDKNEVYHVKGDSIYNSQTYKRYYFTNDTSISPGSQNANLSFIGLVREDTTNKKIYGIRKGTSSEKLMYDFDISDGDTLIVYALVDMDAGQTRTVIFDSKDSTIINGKYHMRIKLRYFLEHFYEYWISGIGSDFGPLNPGRASAQITDIHLPKLLCYSQNGSVIYSSNWSPTCFLDVGLNDLSGMGEISIYPNPFENRLTILTNYGRSKVTILNSTGHVVNSFDTEIQEITVDTSKLIQGLYILLVELEGEMIACRKLVKN